MLTSSGMRKCQHIRTLAVLSGRVRATPAVDITAMTSPGHVTSSVTSPIDSARPLSYRLPIVTNLLSPVVSERLQRRTPSLTPTDQTLPGYTSQPYGWGIL